MAKRKISNVATEDLVSELQRRKRRLPALERKRDRLREELEEVERQMEALAAPGNHRGVAARGGRKKSAKKAGRRRATGQPALTDVLERVLKQHGTLSIERLMEEIQRAGYQSQSKQFRTIVANTLSRDPRFQRVKRGQYKLAK